MESKENATHSAPPLRRSQGKRKAEAEEVRKRQEDGDAARGANVARLRDPKRQDAGAAQAAVAPYHADIDRYLRSLEVEPSRRPSHDYLQKILKSISPEKRAVLVDWLVEVADEFKLQAETLYLAVSYVDRFLTMNVVTGDKLQLLGVTALLLAVKYEEIESSKMKVNKYADITDNTYTRQQVVKMEAGLLKSLNFEIGSPTVTTFLRRFIASCHGGNRTSSKKLVSVCSYLAELSLLDYDCISYLPSVLAAACLFVARFTIRPRTHPWNLTLQHNTGYKAFDLQKTIFIIHELQLRIRCPDQKAIRAKYEDTKLGCVSTMASPQEIPASFFEDCNK